MKIYDETLTREITEPDLERGRLEDAKRVTHHAEQKQVTHREVMADTVTAACPEGLRRIVVDKPYRPAWDETEDVQRYIPYTDAELAAKEAEKKEQAEQAAKAQEEAEKAAAEEKKAQAEQAAKFDRMDAQVTYTAMMTDTMIDTEG